MRAMSWIVLALSLYSAQGNGLITDKPDGAQDATTFATNRCLAKGGLGIINPDLYIVLDSPKNALLVGRGGRWTGQNASRSQVVVFSQKKVWSAHALPDGFDLSQAIVVSFERDKIRFFDFDEMSGGYYERENRP